MKTVHIQTYNNHNMHCVRFTISGIDESPWIHALVLKKALNRCKILYGGLFMNIATLSKDLYSIKQFWFELAKMDDEGLIEKKTNAYHLKETPGMG